MFLAKTENLCDIFTKFFQHHFNPVYNKFFQYCNQVKGNLSSDAFMKLTTDIVKLGQNAKDQT